MNDVASEVMGLVQLGRTGELVSRLAPLTVTDRRAIASALTEYIRTPDARRGVRTPALLAAGAGCLSTALKVAAWLNRREWSPMA